MVREVELWRAKDEETRGGGSEAKWRLNEDE